jgi:hypothetical protein
MYKILVLICGIGTPGQSCDLGTAVEVVATDEAPSAQQCGFRGQALLAASSMMPEPGKQYLKILCIRGPEREAAR